MSMYLHDKSATHSLQLSSWKRSGVKCYEKKKSTCVHKVAIRSRLRNDLLNLVSVQLQLLGFSTLN